ncbi:uracil-DNA glycosylase [Salipiger sp. IMCC34102]|uniref:uracil-DNA glycosylase n=1 Tax=Salipiger sp. IMCC34102 TaxID=2510647 RepID=UPI00101B9E23|nr:uracil-DNA glycosylase [Salipiger sp. IMCC34102]RYH01397.1 uracil-DNA glycosylase [Salipiger sp. IMCC34102]
MESYWSDLALLDWQVELGAVDAIGDAPVDRTALEAVKPAPKAAEAKAPPPPVTTEALDPVRLARDAAAAAADLEALAKAQADFDLCEVKRGARNFVFSDGTPGARVMILGEAPGANEDRVGKPFVGEAGQLLDRMLAAIGLDRAAQDPGQGVYITNVLPWRPPGNATPGKADVAMMVPFVERHVALAAPDVLVLMGNTPCGAMLGRQGITRMRGTWVEVLGRPALPMFHPAYLLRNTAAKREAWADLLALKAKLRDMP